MHCNPSLYKPLHDLHGLWFHTLLFSLSALLPDRQDGKRFMKREPKPQGFGEGGGLRGEKLYRHVYMQRQMSSLQ
jgi:hypothetical protein